MKFEPTFIFAALIALGVLGYGISGNFLSNSKAMCEADCKNITLQEAPACVFNGTYFKKEFFVENYPGCKENFEQCEKQFCGIISYNDPIKVEACIRLCQR